jgi:hypothetical protein
MQDIKQSYNFKSNYVSNDILIDETGDIMVTTSLKEMLTNIILNGILCNFDDFDGFNYKNYFTNIRSFIGEIGDITNGLRVRIIFYLQNRPEVLAIKDIDFDVGEDYMIVKCLLYLVSEDFSNSLTDITLKLGDNLGDV